VIVKITKFEAETKKTKTPPKKQAKRPVEGLVAISQTRSRRPDLADHFGCPAANPAYKF
jgi:hypothetical protein